MSDADRNLDEAPSEAAVDRGVKYFYEGDLARAIEQFDEALRSDPNCARAISSRGSAYFRKREYERAVADFGRLLELNPDDADARYKRALAYKAMGLIEQAREDYQRALASPSTDAEKRKSIEAQLRRLGRSRSVTIAGVLLVFFGWLGIAQVLAYTRLLAWVAGNDLAGLLAMAIPVYAGLATVFRWRGWRFLAGTFAWVMIAGSVMGVCVMVLSLIHAYRLGGPWDEMLLGSVNFSLVLALFASATAAFILWAKRREPRPVAIAREPAYVTLPS